MMRDTAGELHARIAELEQQARALADIAKQTQLQKAELEDALQREQCRNVELAARCEELDAANVGLVLVLSELQAGAVTKEQHLAEATDWGCRIVNAEARIIELEAALKPFALAYELCDSDCVEDDMGRHLLVRVGDLRVAHGALWERWLRNP